MTSEYWTGGVGWNVSAPLQTAAPPLSGQQLLGVAAHGDDTLLRVGVQGRFMYLGIGNGTTINPADQYWMELEAWVGVWSDGGDTTLTIPTDPFDLANPTPGWVWTSFLTPEFYPLGTLVKGQSAMLRVKEEDRWSHAQRKGRPNPVGSNHSLYLCWNIDSMVFPPLGSVSGGVAYNLGMDFDVRALFRTTH